MIKGELDLVALGNEDEIVLRPERQENTCKIADVIDQREQIVIAISSRGQECPGIKDTLSS
jgi:hypothetical protein